MSVHVTSAVWKSTGIKGSDLLVLLSLGDQSNDGGWCWPAVGSIVRRTELSRSTVQRALKSLEAGGVIEVFERPGGSHLFRVLLGADLEVEMPDRVGHIDTPPRSGSGTGGVKVTGGGPDHGAQTIREPSEKRDSESRPVLVCSRYGCDKGAGHAGHHRDPWFDELVELFGYTPAKDEAALFGWIAARCRELETPTEEIKRRAAVYATTWPEMALTVPALKKHWDWLGSTLANASTSERQRYADALARQERRRRLRGGDHDGNTDERKRLEAGEG